MMGGDLGGRIIAWVPMPGVFSQIMTVHSFLFLWPLSGAHLGTAPRSTRRVWFRQKVSTSRGASKGGVLRI